MARLWWLVVGGILVLATACQSELVIDVVVEEDGSGQVVATLVMDRDAASRVLDLQRDGLSLEDLFQAGWVISPPETSDDGAIAVSAGKSFGTAAQFSEIMAELSGDDGLIRDFRLTRTRSFAEVEYQIEGQIQPGSFELFSDEALDRVLGRSVTELANRYGATPSALAITVRAQLPGTIDPEASNGIVEIERGDGSRMWRTRLDATNPTALRVTSSTREVAALVWRGIAVVAAVLAVLVAFGHVLRVLRPERRRGSGGRSSGSTRNGRSSGPTAASRRGAPAAAAASRKPTTAPPESPPPEDPHEDRPDVVALDGMGVLYREGNDINQLLVPFVQGRGSSLSSEQIAARARAVSLGRLTEAEFWSIVGIEGDPRELDDEYLNLFHLSPGVVRFLRELRQSGVRVACLTNDGTGWSAKLRAKHSLDGLIDPWVVSGAVGVRKPDRPIFEVLRRTTGVPPSRILVVDDDLDVLDAARTLGFRTAWFSPDAASEDSRSHAILRSFEVTVPE